MSSYGGPSRGPAKGQGLLRDLICHLSFSLDAVCFIIAFWIVDQCTFGSAERQARQEADKAKKEEEKRKREEDKAGYFGKWWKRRDEEEKPMLSASPSANYHAASEPVLKIPSDLGPAQPLPARSSTADAAGSPRPQSPTSPTTRELHHFQKKILKKQMARSLSVAIVLRRLFLTSLAIPVLFFGALLVGLDMRRHLKGAVGWH